jgi:hypothetical protein
MWSTTKNCGGVSGQSRVARPRLPFPEPREDPGHHRRCGRLLSQRFPCGGSLSPFTLSFAAKLGFQGIGLGHTRAQRHHICGMGRAEWLDGG